MNLNNTDLRITSALISSWRKEPAVQLAQQLTALGVKVTASGGTAQAISDAGLNVTSIESYTGFSELLQGRVKTLHPIVFGAILARGDNASDRSDLEQLGIQPFDLVAVDLYPFPEKLEPGEAVPIELIDIGGVSLIRAAAKNYQWVTVLYSGDVFDYFGSELIEAQGLVSLSNRTSLAREAFEYTSAYDQCIAAAFAI